MNVINDALTFLEYLCGKLCYKPFYKEAINLFNCEGHVQITYL